uniref:CinA-like protein n=1 Tax=Thermorudis peleae TaxID=1382356 RepID=A0A831TEF9_9BACT
MRAVVLSIGSELLDGHLTDTNATFLAQELTGLGVELVGVSQVGDRLEHIVRALRRAWEDAELMITTGGIGPTADDLTREAIAALLGEPVTVDPDLLEQIRAFFAARGLVMPEQNSKQAWLIPSAEPLPNPIGTAPGWFVHKDGHFIVTMPGVPREMERMWREQAVPRLTPYLGGGVIRSATLKTIGLGESAVEQVIADLVAAGYPIVATYAKDDGVHVRITAQAADARRAEDAIARVVKEIRSRLGDHVYGDEATSLGTAALEPLRQLRWKLGIVEVDGGGRLSHLLIEEPLARDVLAGCLVSPGRPARSADGLESLAREAIAAARADLEEADCVYAVVIQMTPGETPDRTRGEALLYLDTPAGSFQRRHQVTSPAYEIRRRVSLWAAEFLRLALLQQARQHAPD